MFRGPQSTHVLWCQCLGGPVVATLCALAAVEAHREQTAAPIGSSGAHQEEVVFVGQCSAEAAVELLDLRIGDVLLVVRAGGSETAGESFAGGVSLWSLRFRFGEFLHRGAVGVQAGSVNRVLEAVDSVEVDPTLSTGRLGHQCVQSGSGMQLALSDGQFCKFRQIIDHLQICSWRQSELASVHAPFVVNADPAAISAGERGTGVAKPWPVPECHRFC